MSNIETLKEKVGLAEEFARKIWLAGIGAYGKAFDEAQGQYDKLNTEASKVFKDFVAKGEKLEGEAKEKFSTEKTAVTTKVEERVAEVREKLGLNKTDVDVRIEEMSAKIDALADAVAKLAK